MHTAFFLGMTYTMTMEFASRAGNKLQAALTEFNIAVSGHVCADFGSSTGGFVDCLLQNGAIKVYSVDTSYGELAWKLRNDPKVVVLERTNAMHVMLPEKVDLITVDVAWTKQEKVLPNVFRNLKENGIVISLIKPHYEAKREELQKGRVKDEAIDQVLDRVKNDISMSDGEVVRIIESPILGERGKNKEFLAWITK